MRAAVYEDVRDIRLRDLPEPKPGPGEVLLAPKFVGICGTDLRSWQYGMYEPGLVIGHEFSAEVVDVGDGVTKWKKGDRVVPNSLIPCGECAFCVKDRFSLCQNMQMVGISTNGGMADLVTLPDNTLYRLPKSVTNRTGALVEPLSVVIRGFGRAKFEAGSDVLILGAGPIGLLSLLVAKAKGAGRVIVSEINPTRRAAAASLGADNVIDPSKESVSLRVESLTSSLGTDLVLECTGAPGPSSETFRLVKRGGTVLVLGICEEPVEADFMTGVLNELSYQFSYLGYAEFPAAIRMIAHGLNVEPLVSREIQLERVVEDGFEYLVSPDCSAVKILVKI